MSDEGWKTAFIDLMPFVVASMMVETLKKLEWQWKLADQMKAMFLIAMLPVADGIIRALIGPELEKRGLRPLTDWHWQAFRQETEAKTCFLSWLNKFEKMCHEIAEREIILAALFCYLYLALSEEFINQDLFLHLQVGSNFVNNAV